MASNSNESDKKMRGSVMRFSHKWRAYKESQSGRRSPSQASNQSPSSSSSSSSYSSSSGSEWGYPPGAPSGSVAASAAKYRLHLPSSNSHGFSSAWFEAASVRSRRGNPPPKSRLSISSGGGGRECHHRELPLSLLDNMPPLEYDPTPQSSSYYYRDMPPLEYDLPPQSSNYYYRNPLSSPPRASRDNTNCVVM